MIESDVANIIDTDGEEIKHNGLALGCGIVAHEPQDGDVIGYRKTVKVTENLAGLISRDMVLEIGGEYYRVGGPATALPSYKAFFLEVMNVP